MSAQKLILIIGGTGAQGMPIIRQLTTVEPAYRVRVLTRNPSNPRSVELMANPNVELIQGSAANEADLQKAFGQGEVHGAFVNLDGFTLGEKDEVWWGIRCWEIARQHGVKHYVWGNVDYCLKFSDWNIRCGHLDGKGRVGQFVGSFPSSPATGIWSILTSGPYVNMLSELFLPRKDPHSGEYVYNIPIGEEGTMPMVILEDLGVYARWIFDHPEESSGLDLRAATCLPSGKEIAETFTKVTGKPARFNPVSFTEYFSTFWPSDPSDPVGPLGGMTSQENFTGFFTCWQNSTYGHRDFALLDKIYPGRPTLENWMRDTGYDGEYKSVLKSWADTAAAKIASATENASL